MAKKTNGPVVRKPRIVKVYDHHVTYNAHLLYKTHVIYPKIRLAGKWLADCGFAPGQHIQITTGKQRLVIQLVDAPGTDQHAAAAKQHAVAKELSAAGRKPRRRTNVPYVADKKQNEAVAKLNAPAQKLNSINSKPQSHSGLGWLDIPFF
ncbi:SymE family type I addiction module toxin [Edaphocola aurantiacus]|uniref:SymE family type I addiction module toxin n=1 Tax=Edaphocola aurantiacus TaxID=2601682 RepID=UPI001C9831D2|nr:SymE family type I addiction module toxin [Edaphocola aurantiacus]